MNLDVMQRFPNQNAEHRPEECTCETITDILANLYKRPFDSGFNYGATFDLLGLTPADAGLPMNAVFYAQCYRGSLPLEDKSFDALSASELMEANFAAYTPEQKTIALAYRQQGIVNVNTYAEVQWALSTFLRGVGLSMAWFESFDNPNPDGTLPMPSGAVSGHMVACYEDTPLGLRIKPWIGPNYGVGGYAFVPKKVFDSVVTGGVLFNPSASQIVTNLYITYYRLQAIFNQLYARSLPKSS
ncbi:MAG: hypothetical protein KGJ90_02065 [Patescibacteria group bacterium]|nr:hypothetical protein [Patescibacteria group bacterium]